MGCMLCMLESPRVSLRSSIRDITNNDTVMRFFEQPKSEPTLTLPVHLLPQQAPSHPQHLPPSAPSPLLYSVSVLLPVLAQHRLRSAPASPLLHPLAPDLCSLWEDIQR